MGSECSWCARTHEGGPERCLSGVLLVCGGRHYADRDRLFAVLDRVAARMEIAVVRHGAATGADTLAGEWAAARGYAVDPMPADWGRHGRRAGPLRNDLMLAKSPVAAAVAFPGGSGTADMVERCKDAGVPVWEVTP